MPDGPEQRWTLDELLALTEESEFTLAIRGHLAVMRVLDLAIGEVLSTPHALEVSQLSAALKIDLAVALGVVTEEDAAAVRKLNAIRNRFAHGSVTAFSEQDARDFFNTWSPALRGTAEKRSFEEFESPSSVLAFGVVLTTVLLEARVTGLRDSKAHARIANEMVQEHFSGTRRTSGLTVTGEAEERLRLERQKRKEENRL